MALIALLGWLLGSGYFPAPGASAVDFAAAVAATAAAQATADAKIGGTLGATDNVIPRVDGAGGVTLQGSTAVLSDADLLRVAGLHVQTGGGAPAPSASALVELVSTTQALRLPVLTTAQRDAVGSPVAGLVAFNDTTDALNVYSGAAWAAVGGGEAALPDYFSMARVGAVIGSSAAAGSYTTGMQFLVVDDVNCTGVRFHWGAATARTVRVKLWDATTQLATADVAVDGAAVYTGTFGAPVALTPYATYYASIWEVSGTEYIGLLNLVRVPARPFVAGVVDVLSIAEYGTGDALPNSGGGSTSYPVDPVIQ